MVVPVPDLRSFFVVDIEEAPNHVEVGVVTVDDIGGTVGGCQGPAIIYQSCSTPEVNSCEREKGS